VARYHGRSGKIYLAASGTGTAVNIGSLTEWSLNMATDKVEVTALNDANKQYVQGLKDLQGSFSGFFDDATIATLDTAASSSDGVKLYLYPSSSAASIYWYGPAWLDLSISTGVNAAVGFSGSFAANGAWGSKTS
jgi:hypothetical protein